MMGSARLRHAGFPADAGAERRLPSRGALPVLLTTAQVAELLAVSVRTVKRLAIPHFKVGRQVRYDARSVTRWLAAREEP